MKKSAIALGALNTTLSKGAVPYEWNAPSKDSTDYRFTFEHDESEIIYSNAFKRLSGKSQMIIKPLRDHFRSRLSHTLEVREIALMIGRALGLNLSLISVIALGHDIGHAPFGHAGEGALQRIVRREIKNLVGITIPDKEESFCFHHASNSARILALWLDQTDNRPAVTRYSIRGVLCHSWSPWKGKAVPTKKSPIYGIPDSYEAQVVAMADQIAGINHDTEDLLEAFEYTHYTVKRFDREMKACINQYKSDKKYGAKEKDVLESLFRPTLSVDRERGYGRKKRIETAIKFVIDNGRKVVFDHDSEGAKQFPIAGVGLIGEFLDLYENFIRNVLDRHTWFMGRNSMADAIVTTVFNHLWPTAQQCAGIAHDNQQTFEEERRRKAGRREIEVYRDHYRQFFDDSYKNPERSYNLKIESSCLTGDLGLDEREIWSSFLMQKCTERMSREDSREKRLDQLLAIIPLIHFVSGLTDRYCLEIFNATHNEFLST